METEVLERRFAVIGARVNVVGPQAGAPRIDVTSDRRGEFFDVRFAGGGPPVELEVVDVDRADRHLLLLVREGQEKSKFLCGHDERHWFVAAVPEDALGVTGVAAAKAALQPELVRTAVRRDRPKHPLRRRNAAYVRQGEWFFVPAPEFDPPAAFVLRNEPLSRGRGKDHVMELAFRRGGETVYVNEVHPGGLTQEEFEQLPQSQQSTDHWRVMVRNPDLYAKGSVRHPDHDTIVLRGWHRVLMNTEQGAGAMRHVAFLD